MGRDVTFVRLESFLDTIMQNSSLFFGSDVLLVVVFLFSVLVEPILTGQSARDYLAKNVNPTLLKGLAELCRTKPKDPLVSVSCLLKYLSMLLLIP
jgi:hypothetical protein